jgi:uncharacterized protein (TIGR02594 family)
MTWQPRWYVKALEELHAGVREIAGGKHNPRIVAYHQATGLKASTDEVPWCGAFVAWAMQQAGVAYGRARAAAARSWLEFGEPMDKPELGAIAVFWRGRKDGTAGHVGFYAGETEDGRILVLGGNQGNAVSIAAYPRERLLGYRWPNGERRAVRERLSDSRTVKAVRDAGGALTAGVGVTALEEPIREAAEAIRPLADYSSLVPYVLLLLALAFAGVKLWRIFKARQDDWREGRR